MLGKYFSRFLDHVSNLIGVVFNYLERIIPSNGAPHWVNDAPYWTKLVAVFVTFAGVFAVVGFVTTKYQNAKPDNLSVEFSKFVSVGGSTKDTVLYFSCRDYRSIYSYDLNKRKIRVSGTVKEMINYKQAHPLLESFPIPKEVMLSAIGTAGLATTTGVATSERFSNNSRSAQFGAYLIAAVAVLTGYYLGEALADMTDEGCDSSAIKASIEDVRLWQRVASRQLDVGIRLAQMCEISFAEAVDELRAKPVTNEDTRLANERTVATMEKASKDWNVYMNSTASLDENVSSISFAVPQEVISACPPSILKNVANSPWF